MPALQILPPGRQILTFGIQLNICSESEVQGAMQPPPPSPSPFDRRGGGGRQASGLGPRGSTLSGEGKVAQPPTCSCQFSPS